MPKPASLLRAGHEYHQSTGRAEFAYPHLAAFVAVEHTVLTYSYSIWANRPMDCSLLGDSLASGVEIAER